MIDDQESPKSPLDGAKLYFDCVKHLTTLASASLLAVVTLAEKVFDKPQYVLWVAGFDHRFFSFTIFRDSEHADDKLANKKRSFRSAPN